MAADSPLAQSHRQRVHQLWSSYDRLIEDGSYVPFGYPFAALPGIIIIGYFLLPQRYTPRLVRICLAMLAQAFCLYFIMYTRARNASTSAIVGLGSMYLIMWITANLILVDPKKEYARIFRVQAAQQQQPTENGITTPKLASSEMVKSNVSSISYHWEYFPSTLKARWDWTLDLITSLDGMGWSWAISTLPPPPDHVQSKLLESRTIKNKRPLEIWGRHSKLQTHLSEGAVYRKVLRRFIIGYLGLDIVKTLGSVDPYFWGYNDYQTPPYLPQSFRSPLVVKTVRLLVAQGSMHLAIQTLLCVRPLVLLAFHTPESAGVRAEAWMSPDPFGNFATVFDNGLAGFWSIHWHQSFRHVFIAPTRAIIMQFKLDPRGIPARIIRMYIAFLSSGLLHACLSYTAIGKTSPIRGPVLMFALQPVGIILQMGFIQILKANGIAPRIPRWLGWIGNLLFVLFWGLLTAPLLIEDLTKGGQFLFEPVPFSILRGLGLGNNDDGFCCWHGRWFSWRSDGWWSELVS